MQVFRKAAQLAKQAWTSDEAMQGRPDPLPASPPIMAPAAQRYYLGAPARGSLNVRTAKELEYAGVPGGLGEVMRVARLHGGAGTPETLDRTLRVTPNALAGTEGSFYAEPNPHIRVKPSSLPPANTRADTLGHETTHASDWLRGTLSSAKADKSSAPVTTGAYPDYYSQRSEQQAGPFHFMKAWMANHDRDIPKTEGQAWKTMQRFRELHKDDWDTEVPYPQRQWDAILKSPSAAKTYLQTVRAPTVPPLGAPATPPVNPVPPVVKMAMALPRLVKTAASWARRSTD